MPPAPLALATLLQAYPQVSADEVSEATTMDRRWQLVLDCLDCATSPFSKGTLVAFRQRLSGQQMERRLRERTVESAATSGACARGIAGGAGEQPAVGRRARERYR